MSRIFARIVALVAVPRALSATAAVSGETLPAVAAYEGAHAAGSPLGLFAVAAGFVVVGGWLLWVSSRSRT